MEFELPKDFRELLESFNRHEVRYLLIGGYAVGLHGYPRSTTDIDIAVADDRQNAERIVSALAEFGFTSDVSPELFTRKDSLVVMGVEPVAVDILNYLNGLNFDESYSSRRVIRVEDIDVSVLSLEDLIRNKEETGRLKDLADVEELKRRNPDQSKTK